ncbi:PAS domain S-box protein [Bacillus solitudinis]|uniref:PAS domain S-box protein n=1 Tax=Bacillus solitudinis TaxID=2014074 RepID=UPI000C23CD5B|nr:PAS domain S-box protein [Bacillus solitudinis]
MDSFYKKSFEASLVGQAFVNRQGEFQLVNSSFCQSVGYNQEHLLSIKLQSLIIQEDECLLNEGAQGQQFEKMILHGEGYLQSFIFTIEDLLIPDSLFLVQLDRICLPVELPDSPLVVSVHGRDEVRLPKKILDGIKDAIVTVSLNGQFLYVNDEAQSIFELSGKELKDLDFWSFIQEDKHEFLKKIYPLLVGEDYVEVEFFKEKQQTWFDVRAYRSDDQVTLYFINITNRKQMEQDLRDSELRYKSLVEHTPETISVHDEKNLIYINPAGGKLFQTDKLHELFGKPLMELFLEQDVRCLLENIKLLLAEKSKVLSSILTLHCMDGQVKEVEATTTVIFFRGKPAFRTMLNDLSDRKKMDDLIRKSDKLAVVAQLAAGVAHEIRNPLTTIKGFLQLFERDKEYNSRYLTLVMEELGHVESIIYEYLALAKPNHQSQFEKVNLKELIFEVTTLLERQMIMKNAGVKLDFEDVPLTFGSEKQLKQVFINLIRNALDAVGPNGVVIIRLFKYTDNQISIQVEDNGCGMTKERVERLGEPFYSTKEKGTGLGLMVCYKILEHHCGLIKVNSQLGKGTKMEVILPSYEGKPRKEALLI